MKKQNTRSPLQSECERVCKFEYREQDCDYYQGNARPGYEINDPSILPSVNGFEKDEYVKPNLPEKTGALVYIDVKKICPHPDNPRKDLGDLSELAESIKSRGIMQNLTVVARSNEDGGSFDETGYIGDYTVIIGHRRLAAAKIAGIAEVPCVIAKMDEKEQVSTMLLENMQRSDLTVIEQAQGFQLMLNLGETTQTISEKTGFSETTVRKRLFVASLDAKKSKNAYERGASLEDYMKLQKLSNKKNRNKVLEALGTHNFDYALRNALSEELRDRVAPKIIKQIEEFAKPTDKSSWELKGYGY